MSADVAEGVRNLELPSVRTLNDFIFGSARFQLPNLKGYDKWGNRVVKNLLYYQTNYLLIFLSIYSLMLIFNPLKIVCGLLVQAMIIAIVLHFFSAKQMFGVTLRNANIPNQKWYFLAGSLLIGYLLLHYFDAILLSTFTLLLPFSLTFVHASLRLRNLKNKVTNTMVTLNPSTPMGMILGAFNIAVDSILN